MNNEIYTYTRKELEENLVIMNEKSINQIKYITENTLGNLYLPNTKEKIGTISYINNIFISPVDTFNTSIETILTKDGSIVFNFNYTVRFFDSRPNENEVFIAKPTFTSGKYSEFKNLTVSVQILSFSGDRIVSILY